MNKYNDESFFKYVRSFLTVYLPRNKCYSPNTVKSYRDTINLLRVFFLEEKKIPFTKITFNLIDRALVYDFLSWLYNSRTCAISTRNQRLAALKSFLYYCANESVELMAVYTNIAQISALRDMKKQISYMTKPALKSLLAQPDPKKKLGLRNRYFMILMYDTGGRMQEILDLKLKDICFEADIPCIYLTGKGSKIRAVPLMDKTILHTREYIKTFHSTYPNNTDDYLFYTVIRGKKGPMSPDNVSVFIKKCAEQARKFCPEIPEKVHAHLFRHSRSMHLYQSGIPLSYIKDFLGHVSVSTTDIYACADTTMIRDALEKAANMGSSQPVETPIWKGDNDMILKLCGLK